MKLAKIKKALKRETLDIVTGEDGFQWIGDGAAFYLADRNLDLTKDNLMAIMDIKEEKRDKYKVREIEGWLAPQLDVCPQEDCDELLSPLLTLHWVDEQVTIMVTAEGEAVIVPQRHIEPADGKEPLAFYLRKSVSKETGEVKAPCVAVFNDMLCCAAIMPLRAEAAKDIWAVMRKACAEGLRYCVEEKEKEHE